MNLNQTWYQTKSLHFVEVTGMENAMFWVLHLKQDEMYQFEMGCTTFSGLQKRLHLTAPRTFQLTLFHKPQKTEVHN